VASQNFERPAWIGGLSFSASCVPVFEADDAEIAG
jgi:hypothetical protein